MSMTTAVLTNDAQLKSRQSSSQILSLRMSRDLCRALLAGSDLQATLVDCAGIIGRALDLPFIGVWLLDGDEKTLHYVGGRRRNATDGIESSDRDAAVSTESLVGR